MPYWIFLIIKKICFVDGTFLAYTRHEPVGVCGQIIPVSISYFPWELIAVFVRFFPLSQLLYVFNDRFYPSFFVATRGYRDSGFDFYWILYESAQKSRLCVYISTPLNRYQPKSRAICTWSMVQVSIRAAEKTRFNTCANNKGTDQSARPRRLISTFVVRWSSFFFSFFFDGEASQA